jgi:hypothetical protein
LSLVLLSACQLGKPTSGLLDDTPAPSTPDLTVTLGSAATVANGKVKASLTFKNLGLAMPGEVPVRTKLVLFPKADYAQRLVGTGLVLETVVTPLNLGAGQSVTVEVEKDLPNMPSNTYFLGATTNTDATTVPQDTEDDDGNPIPADTTGRLVESYAAQMNNAAPDLVDLGVVENIVQEEPGSRGKYDLAHEVGGGTISFDGGTASHSSRNILRVMDGGEAVLPPRAQWAKTVSARFLFADLEHGKLSMGGYTSYSIDKVWTGIAWQPEADAAGHPIYVDYYGNAPTITHLAPGSYVMGVLMNVNDQFEIDSYPENNLDLTYMNLTAPVVIGMQDEVWISANENGQGQLRANINDATQGATWSYEVTTPPAWLQISEKLTDWYYAVKFKADAAEVPLGMTELAVTVKATRDGQVYTRTGSVKIFKNGGPVLQILGYDDTEGQVIRLDSEGVTVTEDAGVKTLHYDVKIKNAGTETLYYSVSEASTGMRVAVPESRVLQPGQAATLAVSFVMVGIAIPREGESSNTYMSFSLMSNGGQRYVSATLELGVPGGGGGGDGDWDDDEGDGGGDGPIFF